MYKQKCSACNHEWTGKKHGPKCPNCGMVGSSSVGFKYVGRETTCGPNIAINKPTPPEFTNTFAKKEN